MIGRINLYGCSISVGRGKSMVLKKLQTPPLTQLQHPSADTILLIKKLCFENCGVGTTNLFGVADWRFVCGNV